MFWFRGYFSSESRLGGRPLVLRENWCRIFVIRLKAVNCVSLFHAWQTNS